MKTAGPAFVRFLGFGACLLALPLFLAAGWTLGGWALGVALFAANFVAYQLADRLARGKGEVTAVGITGISLLSRAWITIGVLFLFAELVDKHAGLVAGVSFAVYFTVDFLVRSIGHVAGGGITKTQEPG
jgi:hypothetical protein